MRRFFIKLLAFALTLALPFAGWFAWMQAKPAMFEASLMGAADEKQALLQKTEGARVLVVGGSSTSYSIISEMVAEETGMPCINLGLTAYLGMGFYLAQLRGNLHEGDLVILAPEYTMYQNEVSGQTIWMAVENHADVMKRLPLSYLPDLLKSYHLYAGQKQSLLEAGTAPQDAQAGYLAAGYGPWGDITFPRENIMEQKYNTQDRCLVSAEMLDQDFLRAVNRFAAQAARAGARVYLTYAPYNRLALEGGIGGVEALEARLRKECRVPLLGSLTGGIMEETLFYDSNNHLNSEGARLRTRQLLEELRAVGAF